MIDSSVVDYQSNPLFEVLKKNPVVFFCAEYALSEKLPIYAGGLGILAGDIVREAADQMLPLVAIGLFYYEGFVGQTLNLAGDVVDIINITKPEENGLVPVVDQNNNRIIVEIPIQDRIVSLQVWKWQQGSVPVYLLDADLPLNSEVDKEITRRLYATDKEMRLKQSMVL